MIHPQPLDPTAPPTNRRVYHISLPHRAAGRSQPFQNKSCTNTALQLSRIHLQPSSSGYRRSPSVAARGHEGGKKQMSLSWAKLHTWGSAGEGCAGAVSYSVSSAPGGSAACPGHRPYPPCRAGLPHVPGIARVSEGEEWVTRPSSVSAHRYCAWKAPHSHQCGPPTRSAHKTASPALHPPIAFNCCGHVLQGGIAAFPGDASNGEINAVKT